MIIIPDEDMPRLTGEPTHEGEDGRLRPGPVPQGPVTREHVEAADRINQAFKNARENNNRYSANNPQIAEPFSPLEILAFQALRRYGDMNPGTVGGETVLMFLEFGNLIIEDLRAHPYWDGSYMDYYLHPTDIREIPDVIVVAGLLAYYSMQQMSSKTQIYVPSYRSLASQILYNRKYGNGPLHMSVVDR
jgi:hypothetical protein